MADLLARMRTTFVEGVAKEVIKQLLDDLLEDGVLNNGEKDSILEENPNRADRAHSLIDTVRNKGDEASTKMLTRLESRDRALSCKMAQVTGQLR